MASLGVAFNTGNKSWKSVVILHCQGNYSGSKAMSTSWGVAIGIINSFEPIMLVSLHPI